MAEGLPDGVRMKPTQYKAMLARDRTIKRVSAGPSKRRCRCRCPISGCRRRDPDTHFVIPFLAFAMPHDFRNIGVLPALEGVAGPRRSSVHRTACSCYAGENQLLLLLACSNVVPSDTPFTLPSPTLDT